MQDAATINVVACSTELLTVTVRVLSLYFFHSMVLTLATQHAQISQSQLLFDSSSGQ